MVTIGIDNWLTRLLFRGFSIRGLAQKYGCATTTMRDILQYRTYNKDKDLE